MVEGERGPCLPPPPLEMAKKMLSKESLTSFAYVLLMKLGGNRYTIHAKWKGVGGQARVHGKGRGGLAPLPLEMGRKEAVRGNFIHFHLYFSAFLI